MDTLTGRSKQAIIAALRAVARDKRAKPQLKMEAALKLLELEGEGISNYLHNPHPKKRANGSKLKSLADEIVTSEPTPGIIAAHLAEEREKSESVLQ